MSVLDQQCRANSGLVFADIGGGGGGGGASTFVTASVSTLTVSSIVGAGGQPVEFTGGAVFPTAVEISSITSSNPAGTVIQNGLNFTGGAGMIFDAFPAPGGASLIWTAGDGEVTGLSTINGQPWNAASVAPSLSTVLAGAVTVGSTFQVLAPNAISTVPGKYYWAGAQILDLSLIGAPTLGDSCSFSCGQEAGESYLQTVDSCAASTIRGRNGTVGFSMNGLIEATSSYTFFQAKMNGGATASTFVSMAGNAWLTPVD